MVALKVAILTGFDPYEYKGGLEKYILNLVKVLRHKKYEIEIFFPKNFRTFKDIFSYTSKIKNEIEKNYELLIMNSPYSAFAYDFNIKKIVIFHGSFRAMAEYTKDYIKVEDYLSWYYVYGIVESMNLFSPYNIVVSPFLKTLLEKLYGEGDKKKQLIVIESGVDTNKFKPIVNKGALREKYGIPKDAFVGLFVGRNDSTKGYDIFTKVFGETKKYVYWIQALSSGGVNQYEILPIKTFKEVNENTMIELYNLSDFTYLPSRFEGFGYSFVESLSCCTPAITTDIGIAREFSGLWNELKIRDPKGDLEYMIEVSIKAIKLLKEYPYIRYYLGNLGREEVLRKYSMEIWEKKILKLINKLINHTSSSPNE